MKAISTHLGILITLLAIIYGLWQQYEYEFLIYKTIQVFVFWMIGSYIFQLVLQTLIPKTISDDDDEEEQVNEKVPVEEHETK